MFIVHGTFDPKGQRFILWGESEIALSRKRGRRAKNAVHPFACSGDLLREWVTYIAASIQGEACSLTLWLPGSERAPQASPELQATGVFAWDASTSLQLLAWQVDGLILALSDAIRLLVALPQRSDLGRDLRFWRAAVLEALALVASQQVLPTLERDGFHLRAGWRIVPEAPERLSALAAQMPPVCRALTETPEHTVSPLQLLDAFITQVVALTVREAATKVKAPRERTTGARLVEGAHRGRSSGEAPCCRR